MRWKNWLPLAVALVFGVLAAKVARDMIVSGGAAARNATGETTAVVVAADDIAPGDELTAERLATIQVPAGHATGRTFRAVSELVGSVAQIEIPKGTEIGAPMLAAGGSGTGLQALVPPGMRAISLEVNEFSGVGGMLAPGSRVDVIVTLSPKEAGGEPVSRTIVQNVKVTAVGQRLTRDKEKLEDAHVKSVTLVTTPQQAEAIELAAANGRPRLVLRSGRDTASRESTGIRLAELRGDAETGVAHVRIDPTPVPDPFAHVAVVPATQPAQAVATRATPTRHTVQLIQGGVESTVVVQDASAAAGPDVYSGATIEP